MTTLRDPEARRQIRDLKARIAGLEAVGPTFLTPTRMDFNRIVRAVCEEFDCSSVAIFGESRKTSAVHPRMAVYALAHELFGMSTPRIGRYLGRDHSTVLSGIERICALSNTDATIAARMQRLRARLTPTDEGSNACE